MFFDMSWKSVILFIVLGCLPPVLHHLTARVEGARAQHVTTLLWATPIFLTTLHLSDRSPVVVASAVLLTVTLVLAPSTPLVAASTLTTALLLSIPEHTTIFSAILGLEFASVLTTALALYILCVKNIKQQLTDLLYPLLVYNFITFVLLVAATLLYVNNPPASKEVLVLVPNILITYVILKVGLTPLLLAKTPIYNYLSPSNILALSVPQIALAIPQILNIHTHLVPLLTVGVVPMYAALMIALGYNMFKFTNLKQLLMYSTPLFFLPLLVLILQ